MTNIEYATILRSSCDDGPGMRTVIFFQGCRKNCPGCHNKNAQAHGKGTTIPIEDLITLIDEKCCNHKVTISGGEPLEQSNALIELAKALHEKNYNICIYTGWHIEQVPQNLLPYVDYIKAGEFIQSRRNARIHFAGSDNQRLFSIQNGVIVNEISLFDTQSAA